MSCFTGVGYVYWYSKRFADYKVDLLNGTPLTAPSRPLVQRALDSALRIAENCDRAQGDVSLLKKTKV